MSPVRLRQKRPGEQKKTKWRKRRLGLSSLPGSIWHSHLRGDVATGIVRSDWVSRRKQVHNKVKGRRSSSYCVLGVFLIRSDAKAGTTMTKVAYLIGNVGRRMHGQGGGLVGPDALGRFVMAVGEVYAGMKPDETLTVRGTEKKAPQECRGRFPNFPSG